ncbi:hypothetical protein E2C01_037103 [Portunus trituberculatus]|uniref:Uncharacterized protein n=1 Tax=Portunus trituberculatus TaxID=210409 RepID=A0A5B7FD83_PORTR|nr:hypothetical protein [Portunus trituberculatus]
MPLRKKKGMEGKVRRCWWWWWWWWWWCKRGEERK